MLLCISIHKREGRLQNQFIPCPHILAVKIFLQLRDIREFFDPLLNFICIKFRHDAFDSFCAVLILPCGQKVVIVDFLSVLPDS